MQDRARPLEDQARLPGGKVTKRLPVLKLELGTGDSYSQLNIIAKSVYGLEPPPPVASRERLNWRTIDSKLYGDAKAAYDGIVNPFLKKPRVFKLEATKSKVWGDEEHKNALEEAEWKRKEEQRAKRIRKMEKKKAAAKEAAKLKLLGIISEVKRDADDLPDAEVDEFEVPMTEEQQLETFLDPFEVPLPWAKDIWKGKVSWVNRETLERVYKPPAEAWADKLKMLEKLTPRDDVDGYEYREDDLERRRRLRQMAEFDVAMEEEIKRRQEEPNDIEQVEDVLYYLVETVCKVTESEEKIAKNKIKKAMRAVWNISTKGFKMRPLMKQENEDGELINTVSDMDVMDMIVSQTGHVLGVMTLPGTFEKHEKEREDVRLIEEERQKMEEIERNRPLADKARIIIALARNGKVFFNF